MQKEFGGYLPLELSEHEEYFARYMDASVLRLDSGRNAIAVAAMDAKPKKIYIPYYNCQVVVRTLENYHIPYERYYLDEHMEPLIPPFKDGEWLLYVNYFGLVVEDRLKHIKNVFKRVIFDNTQAFFAEPFLDENSYNVYSCRKFWGVSDGAYLVTRRKITMDGVAQDSSWERASFLLKSIEMGTNGAYQDNLQSEKDIGGSIRRMSPLTERILRSIDYERARERRMKNFQALCGRMAGVNEFKVEARDEAPFAYPLYVRCPDLRRKLVESKIYVPQWWKYLLEIVPPDSLEARMSNFLLPLPVDQRYSLDDMMQMSEMVLKLCDRCKEEG